MWTSTNEERLWGCLVLIAIILGIFYLYKVDGDRSDVKLHNYQAVEAYKDGQLSKMLFHFNKANRICTSYGLSQLNYIIETIDFQKLNYITEFFNTL